MGGGPRPPTGPTHRRDKSAGTEKLDIQASLAAFELSAVKPAASRDPAGGLKASAPLMFADLAPAGINSQRPPPPPPLSMNAQRTGNSPGHRQLLQQQQQQQHRPQDQLSPPQQQQQQQLHLQQPAIAVQQQPQQPQQRQSPPLDWMQWPEVGPPSVVTTPSPPPPPTIGSATPSPAGAAIIPPAALAPVPPLAIAPSLGEGTFDEIPITAFTFGRRLGTGAFGEVVLANYQGTDVAVKRLRLDPSQPQAAEDFRRELRVLCQLRHRHVVQFLGACTTGPDLCLVMDFCSNGGAAAQVENSRAMS